jgi:drug/metabolite transporter (DMT)-like permease
VNLRDALQLFVLSAIWGASFILIRIGVAELPASWLAVGRLIFGSLFIWSVLLIGKRKLVPRTKLIPLLLVALTTNAIPFLCFAIAEKTVDSSIAAIINASTTLVSALIAVALRDSSLGPRNLGGVVLGFVGVMLAVGGGLNAGNASFIGIVLLLIGSAGYAIGGTVAKKALGGQDSIGIATGQLSFALLMLLPFAAFDRPSSLPSSAAMLAVLALGIVASGVAYLISYDLLSRINATQLSAVTYLLPIWGLFWGWVFGEKIGWTSLLGVIVILAGLALLNAPPTNKQTISSRART